MVSLLPLQLRPLLSLCKGSSTAAFAAGRGLSRLAVAAASCSSIATPAGTMQHAARCFAAKALTPKFQGGKLKPYSSYKGRFKMTGSGAIRYQVQYSELGDKRGNFVQDSAAMQPWQRTLLIPRHYCDSAAPWSCAQAICQEQAAAE